MKRRRWWFVGLALALLVACMFAWKWSERPPFRFMAGATFERLWIRRGFGPDTALLDYRVAQPFDQIVSAARTEFKRTLWKEKQFGKDTAFSLHTDINAILVESVDISPPLLPGEQVRITVARRATWSDRFRIWFTKSVLRDDR